MTRLPRSIDPTNLIGGGIVWLLIAGISLWFAVSGLATGDVEALTRHGWSINRLASPGFYWFFEIFWFAVAFALIRGAISQFRRARISLNAGKS